ncbi:MAG: hypothetical protein ACRDTH_11955 [Pseudonocardiaceae bacterium]
MIDELAARHRALGADTRELTVVFDAGQNSEPTFDHLTEAGLGYLGSLPPSDHGDLLAIPTADYARIDDFDGCTRSRSTASMRWAAPTAAC